MIAASFPLLELVRAVGNVWGLLMVVGAAATLVWFVYATCLRKLLRVRRIENIRLGRILAENQWPEK